MRKVNLPIAALAATMAASQAVLPDNRPSVRKPYVTSERSGKRLSRKERLRRYKKAADHKDNKAGFLDNLRKRLSRRPRQEEWQRHVARMTNWQNTRWMREGRDPERAEY